MLIKPPETNNEAVINNRLHDSNPKYAWIFITIFALILLFALVWSFARYDNKVVIIDDSPNIIVDDEITVSATEGLANVDPTYLFLTNPQTNQVVQGVRLQVTNVFSDKLFAVASGQNELIAYLDETLDVGKSEQIIDVQRGDQVVIDGIIISDFSDRTFDSTEQDIIRELDYLLLVDDIDFVN